MQIKGAIISQNKGLDGYNMITSFEICIILVYAYLHCVLFAYFINY